MSQRKPASAKPTRTRFADYADRWIVSVRKRLAPSTRERYITSLAPLRTSEAIGEFWVDAITIGGIRRWRNEFVGGFAAPTINSHLRA